MKTAVESMNLILFIHKNDRLFHSYWTIVAMQFYLTFPLKNLKQNLSCKDHLPNYAKPLLVKDSDASRIPRLT